LKIYIAKLETLVNKTHVDQKNSLDALG